LPSLSVLKKDCRLPVVLFFIVGTIPGNPALSFFHSAASIFLRRFNPSISSPSILIQRRNLMAIIWMFVLCWFGLFVHCFANGRRTASRLTERAACLMKLSECLALAGEKEFSAILPLRRVHGIGRALSHEPLPPVG